MPPKCCSRRSLLLILCILTLAALSGVVWKKVLQDRFVPKRWGVVEDGLIFRSGQLSKQLVGRVLDQNGVQVVIDLTDRDPDNDDNTAEQKTAESLGIIHKRFPLRGDGTGDIAHYAKAITEIQKAADANTPVLVHCAAGAQRTGGVVYSYRVLVQGKTPQEAVQEMMQYGWDPIDDQVLKDYLQQNIGTLAQMLVEAGVIANVPDPLPVFP